MFKHTLPTLSVDQLKSESKALKGDLDKFGFFDTSSEKRFTKEKKSLVDTALKQALVAAGNPQDQSDKKGTSGLKQNSVFSTLTKQQESARKKDNTKISKDLDFKL